MINFYNMPDDFEKESINNNKNIEENKEMEINDMLSTVRDDLSWLKKEVFESIGKIEDEVKKNVKSSIDYIKDSRFTKALKAIHSLINTPYKKMDCSHAVNKILNIIGFSIPYATTGNMERVYTQHGFKSIPFDENVLQPGDIVLGDSTKGGKINHTEIYLGAGKYAGARCHGGFQIGDNIMRGITILRKDSYT